MSTNDKAGLLRHCIKETKIASLKEPYRGKVRDVYELDEQTLGIVVTDRISAFDHIMRQPIPFKGQILNELAAYSFKQVTDIISTHVIEVPHPNVTIAKKCEPIPIEVVMRGYLTGHAWRTYRYGLRMLCGVNLPEGLKEHDRFPEPILTPATKAMEGHDEDISEQEILDRGIMDTKDWEYIKAIAHKLFRRGSEIASAHGLILVDTKYEFGWYKGELTLIDEVHTTDSSRYFYKDGYEERQASGKSQKQLSKEFLREWLMNQGFQGLEGQQLPDLPDKFRIEVYERYAELFSMLTGQQFEESHSEDLNSDIEKVLSRYAS